MRVQTYTVSASAAGNSHSSIYVPDSHRTPFNIGFGATIATTAHYTVQHTFQDPLQVSAGALNWLMNDQLQNAVHGGARITINGCKTWMSLINASCSLLTSRLTEVVRWKLPPLRSPFRKATLVQPPCLPKTSMISTVPWT